jgi:hypothetical protein
MAEPLRISVETEPRRQGGWVWMTIPKAVVVISYEEFLAGLRRGKAFVRREAYEKRVDPRDEVSGGDVCGQRSLMEKTIEEKSIHGERLHWTTCCPDQPGFTPAYRGKVAPPYYATDTAAHFSPGEWPVYYHYGA